MTLRSSPRACLLALLLASSLPAGAAETTVLRASAVRADKLPDAPVVKDLPAGSTVDVLSLEGGWAWVATPGGRGWMRASGLDLRSERAAAAQVASGRLAASGTVTTLGVRSLPVRANRHALIIGISRYKDPAIASLPGARIDRESATQMAQAMQIPAANIRYLQDDQATGDAIRRALRELDASVGEGDRVFIHYSGHGTRQLDAAAGGCVESLLAHDGGAAGTISNREMADLLAPLSRKTDKMFVMYDACHSGGVGGIDAAMRSRGIAVKGDAGRLRPKFSPMSDECARPVNVKSRNLVIEAAEKGALPQDIVHLSSSRENEISFDDEEKGGLATQFMRDCMLRDAVDRDGSGAISMDEIRMCAQQKIDKRLENDPYFKAHNLVLTGNQNFVPAWFSAQQIAAAPAVTAVSMLAAPVPATAMPSPPAPPTPTAPARPEPSPPVAAPPPPPLTGAQALAQLYEQRDGKRRVQVSAAKERLQIGRDRLDLSVQSDRKGYVYVAMAGSDNEALYVLFPNDLDTNNAIEPGKPLKLPREGWRVMAGGPAGINSLLVMVADAPRELDVLAATKAGPFAKSLNDANGRATLGALMTRTRAAQSAECRAPRKGLACSDAFGATMLKIEEMP